MKKQVLILPALASLLVFGVACGKDSKKSPAAEAGNPPVAEPVGQPVAPNPEPVQPSVSPHEANLKMVGLRFGSEYLTLLNEKIYNVDAEGKIQSEVKEVKQSTTDATVIRETPVTARPRRIDPLNEEFFLLLQPEYNTCHVGACEWTPNSIRPQSNYLVNKKNGDAWEIDSTFVPIPGSVKFVENSRQKTVFFLAHDSRDRRYWSFYPYNKHYASDLKEQLFVYGRKVLVAIDISRPDQKILQPISGNLNVTEYELDPNGNAVVTDVGLDYSESTYLIARNGTQPVISLVKDVDFTLKKDRSYVFRDQAGNLYRYYNTAVHRGSNIARLEIGMEEGRAVMQTVKELSVYHNHTYGQNVAAIREDKDSIYLAMKGDLLVVRKDFSEAKVLGFSTTSSLNDLYLEVLPAQNKAFVAGRSNQVLVATQIDLATSAVKPIDVTSVEGKMTNFVQTGGSVNLITLDAATDTTLIYGFDLMQETFKLKETKPGQVDDRLRILVKVSGGTVH